MCGKVGADYEVREDDMGGSRRMLGLSGICIHIHAVLNLAVIRL